MADVDPTFDKYLPSNDFLLAIVLDCQRHYRAWSEATDEKTQAERAILYRDYAEQLYQLLQDDLHRIARRWLRSGLAPDITSLALNMFTCIFIALPKLHIDPEKNVRSLLLLIAQRGMYDDYRTTMSDRLRQRVKPAVDDASLDSGEQGARMWPDDPGSSGSSNFSMQQDLIDPASIESEDRLIQKIDGQKYLSVILDYWKHALSPVDRQIVDLRLKDIAFKDIVVHLGAGWQETAVRQRYRRVLLRTRSYLCTIGLLSACDLEVTGHGGITPA